VGHLSTLVGPRGPPSDADGRVCGLGRKVDLHDFWIGNALVCWCLWRHRNDIVFEGATPSFGSVIRKILAEAEV
jgi:hypothetical protein